MGVAIGVGAVVGVDVGTLVGAGVAVGVEDDPPPVTDKPEMVAVLDPLAQKPKLTLLPAAMEPL